MCFSWKTHENVGGFVNCVQYSIDMWIFKGIPNVAFVNKFLKKPHLWNCFLLPAVLSGSRKSRAAHRGEARWHPRVAPVQAGQCPSLAPSRGSRAGLVTETDLLTVLIVRQMHADKAGLGFTWEVQPASEGSKAQGRAQACLWGGSSQKQDWRAGQRQRYLQQGSQGGRGLGWAEEGLWTMGKGYAGGGPRWGCAQQWRLVGACRALAHTTYLSHQLFYLNSEAKESSWTTTLRWGW